MQQATDYHHECAALDTLLGTLAASDFGRPTQFRGWSINDVVAHLHLFDVAADLAVSDETASAALWGRIVAALGRGSSLRDVAEAWLDGVAGRALYERWRSFYPALARRYAAVDPKRRVRWAGPDMSARSCITARQMETWAHGQAVYDLLGITRIDSDRLRNVAVLGVNTFAFAFRNRGLAVPPARPNLRLRAPSGALWEWREAATADRIEGSASAFCQVVAQTRHVADTDLEVTGDTARRWMAIAQCFAGPPVDPPPPGTRFRRPSP